MTNRCGRGWPEVRATHTHTHSQWVYKHTYSYINTNAICLSPSPAPWEWTHRAGNEKNVKNRQKPETVCDNTMSENLNSSGQLSRSRSEKKKRESKHIKEKEHFLFCMYFRASESASNLLKSMIMYQQELISWLSRLLYHLPFGFKRLTAVCTIDSSPVTFTPSVYSFTQNYQPPLPVYLC